MNRRAWLAFAVLSLIWGIPYLFIKVAVDGGVSPFFLAWARLVLGASLLFPPADALASIAVLGILCTATAFVVLVVLVKEVGAGRASIITYVNPVVAVTLGVIVLGENPGAGAIAGLLLILAGSWLSTDGRLPPGPRAVVTRLGARGGRPQPEGSLPVRIAA